MLAQVIAFGAPLRAAPPNGDGDDYGAAHPLTGIKTQARSCRIKSSFGIRTERPWILSWP